MEQNMKKWLLVKLYYYFFQKLEDITSFMYCGTEVQKQPPEVFCKKNVFLEISKNWQENTCDRVLSLMPLAKVIES